MRKFAALLLLSSLVVAFAPAQTTYKNLKVAFGKVRRADGSYADITGMTLKAKITPLHIKEIGLETAADRLVAKLSHPRAGRAPITAIYSADQDPGNTGNPQYGVIDSEVGPSSSILDDIEINAAHVNKPWQTLTFGFENSLFNDTLIRWTVMNQYNPAAPNGSSAFQPYPVPGNYLLDFGLIWPGNTTTLTQVKVELSIAAAQVAAPQTLFWFSQQFHQFNGFPDPDAPMDSSIRNAFNQISPPTIGFSDVFFWYDLDEDGMYQEQEKDTFNNEGLGNLLMVIKATTTGTLQDLNPISVTLDKGVFVSGDFTDLWFSDDFYYRAKPDYTQPRSVVPTQVIVEGISPSATVNSFAFNWETATEGGGGTEVVQLWRYRGTPGWVTVKTRTLSGTDSNTTYVYTNANPEQFVDLTTRRVKAKILVTPPATAARAFQTRIDRTRWTVGLP
ncbi:MAG: hypothetical protein ABL949_00245 [Fimbriimonadaceae bacterium]